MYNAARKTSIAKLWREVGQSERHIVSAGGCVFRDRKKRASFSAHQAGHPWG